MPSVKTRVAVAGGKYLITHPGSRITRFVVRFAVRRVGKKLVAASHVDAIPATRGSRAVTVAGVLVVAGGIVLLVRRTAGSTSPAAPVFVPTPDVPFPAPDAVEVGDGDDALTARVRAELFGGTPPIGLTVEAASGVVTLRGQVADEEAEGRIVRDAESIEGVKAVQSELQTAGTEPGAPAS